MPELALIRHGQSEWNRLDRFTGWVDVGLTGKGRREAKNAGEQLGSAGFSADVAYTSCLTRAIHTLWIVLLSLDRAWIDVKKDCRLNERHYGALQGLNKKRTARKYGEEQVRLWRRGYDIPLPKSEHDHPLQNSERYRGLIRVPNGETFRETAKRVVDCWKDSVSCELDQGRNVLVVAHGNSLRGLIAHIERLGAEDIPHLELPTGRSIVYSLDGNMRVKSKSSLA